MRSFVVLLVVSALMALPASAQTVERIKDTGNFRLGFRADAAPLSFIDENDQPAGYSPLLCVEIAQKIANILEMEKLDVTFHAVDATNRFESVASGEIDLLCGAATISLKRREIVDFSVPTYVDGTSIMLPKDASEDWADLVGKKIGVRSGTTTLDALNKTFSDAGVKADVYRFNDHRAGFAAMQTGEIEAYFADQSILYFLKNSRDAENLFKITGNLLTVEKQGLAMARGDTDFRLLVDSAISSLFHDGTIEKLFQRAMPGAEAGIALKAMYLLSPTVP